MDAFQVVLDAPDQPKSRIQIATLGDFSDDRYGEFSITRDDVDTWAENLSKLPGGRALVDLDHRADRKPRNSEAAGWITQIGWDTDGVTPVAEVEWTPVGKQAIEEKRYLFFSPTYGAHADERGNEYPNTLVGGALTNKPFLTSMPAITLAAEGSLEAAVENEEEQHQRLLDVLSTKKRNDLPDSAFALPGRRYPIHDLSHARNALARVAQNGTSDEQAQVRAKVYKKYPELKPSSDDGGNDGDADDKKSMGKGDVAVEKHVLEQADSRPADMDREVLKQLGLAEDTDVSAVLDSIKKLQAHAAEASGLPRRSLEQQARDRGKVVLEQGDFDRLQKDVALGKRAAEELRVQTFDIAFTRAVSTGRAVPDQRESFERFYELDAEKTLEMLDSGPKVVNTRPSGWNNELYEMGDAPPGVDERSHAIDAKVKARLRQLGKPMTDYHGMFAEMMAAGEV